MIAEEQTSLTQQHMRHIEFAQKLINDFCIVNHYYINIKYMLEDITDFLLYIENHLNDMHFLDLISSQLEYFEAILFPLRAMWDQTTRLRCGEERKENRNKLMDRLINYFEERKPQLNLKKKFINIQWIENI